MVNPACAREGLQADAEDGAHELFLWAGIGLPLASRPDREASRYATLGHPRGTAGWVLYRAPERTKTTHRAVEPYQLTLDIAPRNGVLATYIPPSCSAFMNGRICSYFRSSRRRVNLAQHLRVQGVVYLGDLTQMDLCQIMSRLGPYASMLPELEAYLKQIGLSFSAMAPWWRRPAVSNAC